MFEKIKKFFLYFSILFLIAGVTSFTAYNWATMSSIEKLAVPSILIVGGLVAYLLLKTEIYKNLAIFFSSFMIGTLFAVYGQVYQTGADAWILFRNWAIFLIIPIVVTGYYSVMTLFSIVVAMATTFYLNLYLSGPIVSFLSSLIFGMILLVYPFIQKKFNFKFNNIFYNIITAIFYIAFIMSGCSAILEDDYFIYTILLYILFGGAIFMVGYNILKKVIIKILSIVAGAFFAIVLIPKTEILNFSATPYFFICLVILIAAIALIIQSVQEIENENIKKFASSVVGFLKVASLIVVICLIFSLFSFYILETYSIIISATLIIFSYFAAKILQFKKDKLEIVTFVAGLLLLSYFLSVRLNLEFLTILFIVTIIYDIFWFFVPARALDLLVLPLHYLLIFNFFITKLEMFNFHYIIAYIALILEGYSIFNKEICSSEKVRRILCGNELVLIFMAAFGFAVFSLVGFELDTPSIDISYYPVILRVLSAVISVYIIYKHISNKVLVAVLSFIIIALNYFAYTHLLEGLAITITLMLVYLIRESKWGLVVSVLVTVYLIIGFYFDYGTTLLDKSISLSIVGVSLLVAYLVLKYGFKGVESNE